MTVETVGIPLEVNIEVRENDTLDHLVHCTVADGSDANVVGWTALLSIGPNKDDAPTITFAGVGLAGGILQFNMAAFALVKGTYKYDIRVTDTVTLDNPARVYMFGKYTVKPRIN